MHYPYESRHFTKLCKSVYPWESVSEIQSIKETLSQEPPAGATGKTCSVQAAVTVWQRKSIVRKLPVHVFAAQSEVLNSCQS